MNWRNSGRARSAAAPPPRSVIVIIVVTTIVAVTISPEGAEDLRPQCALGLMIVMRSRTDDRSRTDAII